MSMLILVQNELEKLDGKGRRLVINNDVDESIETIISDQISIHTINDIQLSKFASPHIEPGSNITEGDRLKSEHITKIIKFAKFVDCIELASLTSSIKIVEGVSNKKACINLIELYSLRRRVENIAAFLLPSIALLTRQTNEIQQTETLEKYLDEVDVLKKKVENFYLNNVQYSFTLDFALTINQADNHVEIYIPNSKHLPQDISNIISCESRLMATLTTELESYLGMSVTIFDAYISDPLIDDLLQTVQFSKHVDLAIAMHSGHIITKLYSPKFESVRADSLNISEKNLLEASVKQVSPKFDLTDFYKEIGRDHIAALEAYKSKITPLINRMKDMAPSSYAEITSATRLVDNALLDNVFDKKALMNELTLRHDFDISDLLRVSTSKMLILIHNAKHAQGQAFTPFLFLKDDHLQLS